MIPYGRHHIDERDIAAVVEVLRNGALTQGPVISAFERALAQRVGAKFAVAVSSGTAALHLACLAAGIGRDNAVVTSPNTFVASANCALYVGATPMFSDIDPDTLNITLGSAFPMSIEAGRKSAIIPVHFGGLPCDMRAIHAAKPNPDAVIIEDASHALGAMYDDGSQVGSCRYSNMTVFSFHPVKLIAAGEGGMITTNDEGLYLKLLRLRSHGITRDDSDFLNRDRAFCDGELNPWYYEMQELGYNYRITDIQCALALSQLEKLDAILRRRREIAAQYDAAFREIEFITLPQSTGRHLSANHLYVLRMNFKAIGMHRAQVMKRLAELGVGSQVHYIPVHFHPQYQALGFEFGSYPEAEKYYEEAITIPLFYGMSDEDVAIVIAAVKEVTSCEKSTVLE
ncbi:MAG: UDP-4-amino-4,6-dideoxy-N-acetyl-beta-L-altrosamine transaminase [Deltaproteobacteria bacterium]|nr:UDP-4-amino-4,6-dideoxy-N-acetyl-beta-L-altrosamine transaminase [Deltaproteobacteria bacterium]